MRKRRLTKCDKKIMEFNKRYDKFKKNNLPAPFWDEERQVREYVMFDKYLDGEHVYATQNLYNAFENIIWDNFYYSFNCRYYTIHYDENGKEVYTEVIGHMHEHDFDSVICRVYNCPETFSIDKKDEFLYSEQELRFIRRLQKYLNFIGVKDIKPGHIPVSRYRNSRREKYLNASIISCSDKLLSPILSGELNYHAYEYREYCDGSNSAIYNRDKEKSLIVDKDDNFIVAIEFGKSEIKKYKDVKKYYKLDLKDDDKVIVNYFNILERFN